MPNSKISTLAFVGCMALVGCSDSEPTGAPCATPSDCDGMVCTGGRCVDPAALARGIYEVRVGGKEVVVREYEVDDDSYDERALPEDEGLSAVATSGCRFSGGGLERYPSDELTGLEGGDWPLTVTASEEHFEWRFDARRERGPTTTVSSAGTSTGENTWVVAINNPNGDPIRLDVHWAADAQVSVMTSSGEASAALVATMRVLVEDESGDCSERAVEEFTIDATWTAIAGQPAQGPDTGPVDESTTLEFEGRHLTMLIAISAEVDAASEGGVEESPEDGVINVADLEAAIDVRVVP